jgi:hypothetical protein
VLKSLETFHDELPDGIDDKYVSPKDSHHGATGPLHVGNAPKWEKDMIPLLEVFEQAGFPMNPDYNSGDPIGTGMLISSADNGTRSTAADLLTPTPPI